ncbi:hypothetical protein EaACW_1470 [Erwinia amylovora ACW56400]|uniref:Uncharacterized protein n=2 Tax=Erwinia amylovora TaxID=552 RepID=A0A831A476_ERWAM|nr:hypothetical protein EaACW_1470 [Erwinia amylovora ACW56400]CBA20414.1 hypothetical protein predicted by Glimmer/Critica [Erwinia amylovora CFBP1430]CCO78318.1 hypothetical protein BN432_1514 [Erwinia amylovora Ea356]CCO82108.1 hypothetical protein BN433_1530 [Erwinia amylovora Ea266]CCO89691.1 hypothetical protein BN435_1513 [Erwinia amylovora 01SFR-BO]CCO93443.1 hypothetical protein BN437_1507 [Erwinia amylovora NBRC 12687 = CFBP 1232]
MLYATPATLRSAKTASGCTPRKRVQKKPADGRELPGAGKINGQVVARL